MILQYNDAIPHNTISHNTIQLFRWDNIKQYSNTIPYNTIQLLRREIHMHWLFCALVDPVLSVLTNTGVVTAVFPGVILRVVHTVVLTVPCTHQPTLSSPNIWTVFAHINNMTWTYLNLCEWPSVERLAAIGVGSQGFIWTPWVNRLSSWQF